MRVLLIDTLGCLVSGRRHPAVRKVSAALDSQGPAIALASWRRQSTHDTVIDTGSAIRAFDYNDFYWGPGLGGHPSDIFAAALVVAEREDKSLADMLNATAVGYDLYIRLVDIMDAAGPFDHTTAGGFASAAVAGLLLDLDDEAMAHALAMALARGPAMSALRQGNIAEVKAASGALACASGVLAARLATAALTGPHLAIGGPKGIAAFVRPGVNLDGLIMDSRDRPKLLDVAVKRFPCIGTAQAAVYGAIELHRAAEGHEIQSIKVCLADNPVVNHQTETAYRRALTRETADHSFYAVIGMAAVDGDLTLGQFDGQRWLDSDVTEMIDRMTLTANLPGAKEGRFAARYDVRLSNGKALSFEVPYAPDHPQNRLTFDGAVAKFRDLASGLLHADAADTLESAIDDELRTPVRSMLTGLEPLEGSLDEK
jgi:2-methylcitrate dehydratase PrpD